jgi:hypothetical protein
MLRCFDSDHAVEGNQSRLLAVVSSLSLGSPMDFLVLPGDVSQRQQNWPQPQPYRKRNNNYFSTVEEVLRDNFDKYGHACKEFPVFVRPSSHAMLAHSFRVSRQVMKGGSTLVKPILLHSPEEWLIRGVAQEHHYR